MNVKAIATRPGSEAREGSTLGNRRPWKLHAAEGVGASDRTVPQLRLGGIIAVWAGPPCRWECSPGSSHPCSPIK